MKSRRRAFVGVPSLAFALALICIPVVAEAAPARVNLGTAESFAVLAGSTVTNTGPTVVDGDLGVHPGNSVTGFPPGTVNGTIHAGDAVAAQAQSDLTAAYNDAAGRPCDTNLTGQDLGGLTLVAGVYCFDSAAQLTGTLTLNAQGDPDAVFIFQIGSTLTTASGSNVALINGANPCNIFWKVGSSATLGTSSRFQGSILALTSITVNTNATVDGRVLARNGAVTLDSNTIRQSCVAAQPSPSPSPTGGGGASPSPTPTGGGGASPSPSPTGGAGASPSPTPTGGGGGSPAPTPTGGGGGSPAPTPTGGGGGSPAPTPTGGGGGSPSPPDGTPSPSALPSPPPGPNGDEPGTLGTGVSRPSEVPLTGVPSWMGPTLVAALILIVTGLRLQVAAVGVNPRPRLVLDQLMSVRAGARARRRAARHAMPRESQMVKFARRLFAQRK